MSSKFFFVLWGAALAFILLIIGVLAILDLSNFVTLNWIQNLFQSKPTKIAWGVGSMSCFIIFVMLATNAYRKEKDIYLLRVDENKMVLMPNLRKPQNAHSAHVADTLFKEDAIQ